MLLVSCHIKPNSFTHATGSLSRALTSFFLIVQKRKSLLSMVLTVNHVLKAFSTEINESLSNKQRMYMLDNKAVVHEVKRTSYYRGYLMKGVITYNQEAKVWQARFHNEKPCNKWNIAGQTAAYCGRQALTQKRWWHPARFWWNSVSAHWAVWCSASS